MTPAQEQTLRDHITAAFPAVPQNTAGAATVAEALNQVTSDFWVWNLQTPVVSIFDAITWANLTPTDAPDGTAAWTNRSLMCQCKQINLQIILTGREYINASKVTIRAGLQDALTNVPSGAGGATVSAGWMAVRNAMMKLATELEKVLSTGTGTTASPATTSEVITTNYNEIQQIMRW